MLTKCEKCGIEYGIGDFPFCKGGHGRYTGKVVGDDIPGGVLMRHGICEEDGTPKRYYSKSDIHKAAAAKGLSNIVTHVPDQGSDKSKHTSRWI